jgi:hypothetical protein
LPPVQDQTVIIVMLVLLALLLGLVVWSVARVAYAIARERRRQQGPPVQFRHPALGLFTGDDGLWTCELPQPGGDLRLVVEGIAGAPSEALIARAQVLLSRFPELEQQALAFLRQREAELRGAKLDFYQLLLDDEQHPDNFTLEFLDPRDDSRVWRVGFVKDEPTDTSFDD